VGTVTLVPLGPCPSQARRRCEGVGASAGPAGVDVCRVRFDVAVSHSPAAVGRGVRRGVGVTDAVPDDVLRGSVRGYAPGDGRPPVPTLPAVATRDRDGYVGRPHPEQSASGRAVLMVQCSSPVVVSSALFWSSPWVGSRAWPMASMAPRCSRGRTWA